MSVKKIVLKNDAGMPAACATLRREQEGTYLTLPKDVALTVVSPVKGDPLTVKEQGDIFFLSEKDAPLSLLVKRGDETLFFSESQDPLYEKWRLLSFSKKPAEIEPIETEISSFSSDISAETEENKIDVPPEKKEEIPLPVFSEDTSLPSSENEAPSDIETLFEKGEPFPLFETLIEGSRWVRHPEEDCLFGYLPSEDLLFCGVPGRIGEPPSDENWTFLPTAEDDDLGYYIREVKKSERA